MAQETTTAIAHAGRRKWGYDPEQVDAFLERAHDLYESGDARLTQRDIQNVSFDLAKGGYEIAQVDAALTRLERAVADRHTAWQLAHDGKDAWRNETEALYHSISERLDRPAGERFADGQAKRPSYDRKQVDRLADQVADKAAAELGLDGVSLAEVSDLADVTSELVATSTFTQRKGRKGYDERQVDFFFNICVELLSRIESIDRVGDGEMPAATAAEPMAAAPAPVSVPAATAAASAVPPLFSSQSRPMSTPVPAPTASASDGSFEQLHAAERDLFTPPAPITPQPQVAPVPAPSATPVPSVPVPPAASDMPSAVSTPIVPETPPSFAPTASSATRMRSNPVPIPAAAAPVSPAAPIEAPAAIPADTLGSSSLGELAHMAEVSQEMPAVKPQDFMSHMPDLDVDIPDLSFPSFLDTGVHAPVQDAAGTDAQWAGDEKKDL